jgi:hypothetical protein
MPELLYCYGKGPQTPMERRQGEPQSYLDALMARKIFDPRRI